MVAAIGSDMRHDDGVGAAVVQGVCGPGGRSWPYVRVVPVFCPEPLALLGAWDNADLAIVVDAVKSGGPPGEVTVHWLDDLVEAGRGPNRTRSSSHGLGVADVWEVSRLIGTAPTRAAIVGVEGSDFSLGRGLSSSVQAALPAAVAVVTDAVRAVTLG